MENNIENKESSNQNTIKEEENKIKVSEEQQNLEIKIILKKIKQI